MSFKVKWATREQAETVARILDDHVGNSRTEFLRARFGRYEFTWMEKHPRCGRYGSPENMTKRDAAFDKIQKKLLGQLKRDGLHEVGVDDQGFHVYERA